MAEALISASTWGPGFIGLMLSVFLYGSGFGQSLFYSYHFPDDHLLLKLAVTITLALDTVHVYGCVKLYWQILITCRRDLSSECSTRLPIGFALAVLMNYLITFAVQCFYIQRVWVVSGGHMIITHLAIITAVADFAIGLVCSTLTFQRQTIQFIFTTPLVAYSSILSTVCDVIITSSIVYHLRAGRSKQLGQKPKGSRLIRRIRRVFINCGLLTCIASLVTALLYFVQGGKYWVEVTGVVLSRSYVNSMLAVLNARKPIRDRERDYRDRSIEVPSIQII